MKMFLHLWRYLAELIVEGEMSQIKFVHKIKTHILCSVPFFSESCAVYEIMSKNIVETYKWQYNMAHARCMLDK